MQDAPQHDTIGKPLYHKTQWSFSIPSLSPVMQAMLGASRQTHRHRIAATRQQSEPTATQAPPPVSPARFAAAMFAQGAVAGTLLDGIHSRTFLQVYDTLAFSVGGLNSSAVVPPLLGVFYITAGFLQNYLDSQLLDPMEREVVRRRSRDLALLLAAFGALAFNLNVSATLYASGAPYSLIGAVLSAFSAVNWYIFDRTRSGAALAALCAVGAPAAEVALLHFVPLWHYSRPDLFGVFVSWVPLCYFFYAPALGMLARSRA